jgi:DNA-binding transcriptional MerR regulator
MTEKMASGVTIGQAAAFAGVTVKAVRHYHKLGLVDEPRRDRSGYRRYASVDLLRLVRVRTLAAAGVPLAEVGPLLDADTEQCAAALTEVEQRLTERIAELTAQRDILRRLGDGDRLMLPERALVILERLTDAGLSPDYVATQREALILAKALAPEFFDGFMTQLEHRLDDSEFIDLTKRCWDARSWQPDDPRIVDLASALSDNLLAHRERLVIPTGFRARPDAATRYALINSHREDQWPTVARLTSLVEAKLRAADLDIPHE